MLDTTSLTAKTRVAKTIVITLVVASCLPLWYQHSAAGKHWKALASGSESDTWYNPITGYHVAEQEGGYTYSLKHELLGDFVPHSAMLTCKVTQNGKPAAGVLIEFGIDEGVHYGQWTKRVKTGSDGTAQAVLPNDGLLGTDLAYAWIPWESELGSEGPAPLDRRRRSVVDTINWIGQQKLKEQYRPGCCGPPPPD